MLLNEEEMNMIITTTHSVEGQQIVEYKGIVFGEVIQGVHIFKDLIASLRKVFIYLKT